MSDGEDALGVVAQADDGPADEPAGGLGGDAETLADLAEALALAVEQAEAGLDRVAGAGVERAEQLVEEIVVDDRARYAVEARFGLLDGERRSFREVGASLNITAEAAGRLVNRARYAVEARFGLLDGERKSFREVGEQLGVTAEAARRLVSRAVVGLRDDAERILAV